ncbi:MAG TPA: acyloxyacyl hydrolase [Myxococcota bacterium]|nr:acyloxyacyl hydrolase [Myxococcota bacterium]
MHAIGPHGFCSMRATLPGGCAGAVRLGCTSSAGRQFWLWEAGGSIASGYGFGVGIFGSNNGNLRDIRFAALVPRWGIGLTDPLAEGTWYEGNLDLLVEGASLFEYHPQHGFAGGGTLMLRYNLLQSGRAVPFIEAGAGILGTDLDLRGQSDGFNFTVQGGAGLHFFVLPRVAVTAEARLYHISNAGLRVPNSGINDCLFLVGASFFLR